MVLARDTERTVFLTAKKKSKTRGSLYCFWTSKGGGGTPGEAAGSCGHEGVAGVLRTVGPSHATE